MNVYLNEIWGIDDAILSMFMSKRSWTKELDEEVRSTCDRIMDRRGFFLSEVAVKDWENFSKWMTSLIKWGAVHTTLLRFIQFSVNVEGMHRAGQDDWDSHAKRYNNRIIRSSTRLADFKEGEVSTYYKNKIIATDTALQMLNIIVPEKIINPQNGLTYIKTVNGYIVEGMENNRDVKRGLYMLSIPSNFIFQCDLTEYSHVYKERNETGTANPEVKECAESITAQLTQAYHWFDKDLLLKIKN